MSKKCFCTKSGNVSAILSSFFSGPLSFICIKGDVKEPALLFEKRSRDVSLRTVWSTLHTSFISEAKWFINCKLINRLIEADGALFYADVRRYVKRVNILKICLLQKPREAIKSKQ